VIGRFTPLLQAILGAGCAVGLLCDLFLAPFPSADPLAFQGGFRWFAILALVALSAYLCIHLRASLIRARFLLLLLCFLVMGLVALRAGRADVLRYLMLAPLLAAAWLLVKAWPGNTGELAAALALFQPYTLSWLVEGGAEPIALFCFALAAWALARSRIPAPAGRTTGKTRTGTRTP